MLLYKPSQAIIEFERYRTYRTSWEGYWQLLKRKWEGRWRALVESPVVFKVAIANLDYVLDTERISTMPLTRNFLDMVLEKRSSQAGSWNCSRGHGKILIWSWCCCLYLHNRRWGPEVDPFCMEALRVAWSGKQNGNKWNRSFILEPHQVCIAHVHEGNWHTERAIKMFVDLSECRAFCADFTACRPLRTGQPVSTVLEHGALLKFGGQLPLG